MSERAPIFYEWLNDIDGLELYHMGLKNPGMSYYELRGLRPDAPQFAKDAFAKYLEDERKEEEYYRKHPNELRPL